MEFFRMRSHVSRRENKLHVDDRTISITASVYRPAVTEESAKESKKQLHKNLKQCRIRREKAMIDSIEDAKKFVVK